MSRSRQLFSMAATIVALTLVSLRLGQDGEPNPDYKDWGRGTRPVVGVSWYDAQAFVSWLNSKTGEDDLYDMHGRLTKRGIARTACSAMARF